MQQQQQQQQTPVYPSMMSNQQQNVYNPVTGNPSLNRTPSQTPMSISNQQWPTNQAMNVVRQAQNPYNSVSTDASLLHPSISLLHSR